MRRPRQLRPRPRNSGTMREEALIWTWQIPHPALTDILLNTSSDSRAVVSTLLRRALSCTDRNPFNTVESVSTRAARRRHPGTASTGSCCFVSGSLAVSRGLDKVPRRWILHGRASVSSGKPIYARAPDRPAVRPAPERRIKAGAIVEFVEKFVAFDFFQQAGLAPRGPRPPYPRLAQAPPCAHTSSGGRKYLGPKNPDTRGDCNLFI